MQQTIQTFTPCNGDQTEAVLLSTLQSARQAFDSSTNVDRSHRGQVYAAALKAFSDHICGNMKSAHVVMVLNGRRTRK